MRTTTINPETGRSIVLGRRGERQATRVIFDLACFAAVYGEGEARLLHQRFEDPAPYIVPAVREGDKLLWTVTSDDTGQTGTGRAELQWTVGETLAKSVIFKTRTWEALAPAEEEPPETAKSWYEQLVAYIDSVKQGGVSDEALAKPEPAEDDIPKVFFGGDLPQTKDDTIMSFHYISKTEDISGYCKTKAQGSSSMNYPKKNQTVKLYKDAECTEKMKVDFKGWGKQNKFCFKANWIDLSHARNIVSARLWCDVVKSRPDYAALPEELRTSPNQGAVDGFPVKVYANGIYQGRYTLNIPKDAWMANMDDELDTHCILCGEASTSAQFKALAVIDGSDWSDEIHNTVPDSIKTRWNEIIAFVMNSTDDDFKVNLGNYFDVTSLFDYYLFGLASNNFDGFQKNQLYFTYDGQKWFVSAYDMDSTWGLWWTGEEFVAYNYHLSMAEENNLLYNRLTALFPQELQARWLELRQGVLSEANVISEFERFIDICPPWLVEEDFAETTAEGDFTEMPSANTNNIQQIRDYIVNRLAWADRKMSGDENLLYSLQNVTFDGATVVNTGLKLFKTAHESSIFIDFNADATDYGATLLWTATNPLVNPPAAGISIQSAGAEWMTWYVNGCERQAADSWKWQWATTRAVAVTITADGLAGTCQLKYNDGTVEFFDFSEDMNFVPTKGVLVLGSMYNIVDNTGVNYFVGTVNDFRVWDRALSDAEISALFDGVETD